MSYVAEAFAAAVFGAIIVAVLWETGFWRRWIFWRAQPSASAAGVVLGALFAFAALTELFSAVTTLLVAQETVRTADTVVPLTDLYERTEAQYAWHFADAIPALDVPETLKWKVPYEFANAAGGSLVLVYKILVILPIIGLAVDLTARVRDQGTPRATR